MAHPAASAWTEKVAIVTGGSSGLGLAIGRAFARAGASVCLAARGEAALDEARRSIEAQGANVLTVAADVTRQSEVDRLIEAALARFGRIDVLVNNAGCSDRGMAIDTTIERFQELWDLNFLALVRTTRAAIPHLRLTKGHLVNIGSLAGKSAARWLGAYPVSKFAVSAYTQQLRLELGSDAVHVLLVCPGPIGRAAPRVYEGAVGTTLPQSAQRPGGGVKVGALDPDRLAQRIVGACERRAPELVLPGKARLLFAISQLSAGLGDWLVKRAT